MSGLRKALPYGAIERHRDGFRLTAQPDAVDAWSSGSTGCAWWADQNVYRHTHGSKHFHHPIVGPLTLNYESLTLPADPDQRLSVYTVEAGTSSEEALRLLATWIRQPEPSKGQHAEH
ncbi:MULTISPECIES: hypothetical protein [unclassified Streptomyces]|uniref:MmyB family transcriptional regulator n=1 Tax=unclassified Streptomyces TaxID=2593676 RepID=UPI002E0D4A36|nr:hypothetical protein OG452_18690 [Streptomyces sp. NBC_01197]WSS53600.1 hypothetical protein OG708_16560 [Streptomyces sp. NBC_01180]